MRFNSRITSSPRRVEATSRAPLSGLSLVANALLAQRLVEVRADARVADHELLNARAAKGARCTRIGAALNFCAACQTS